MDSPNGDLQVACRPSMANAGDIAFVAQRQRPAVDCWVLYITSDQVAIDIHRVVPARWAKRCTTAARSDCSSPPCVTSVQLEVAAHGSPEQRWKFWVDDDPDVTEISE